VTKNYENKLHCYSPQISILVYRIMQILALFEVNATVVSHHHC